MKSRKKSLSPRGRSFLLFAIILTLTALILIGVWPEQRRAVGVLLVAGLVVRWFVTGRLHRRVKERANYYATVVSKLARHEPVDTLDVESEEEFQELTVALNELIAKQK